MKNVLLKRKVISVGLVITLMLSFVFVLSGCKCSNGKSGDASSITQAITENSLNIDDFIWNVEQTKKSGKDIYTFSLTNNSKYELLGAEINYKTKAGLTPEQLSLFDDFKAKHESYFKDGQTTADVTLIGKKETYIPTSGSANGIPVTIGVGNYSWYDSPTKEQFDLMEPNELVLIVVGSDDVAYPAYYSFADKKWKIDSKTVKLNNWPDSELAKLIPEPKDYNYKMTLAYEDHIAADVYGVTDEYFKSYVEQLKEKGFTEDIDEYNSDSYSRWEAKDKNGNKVSLEYHNDTHILRIHLDSKK